jgi:SAM-dependent methyltransferase
VEKCRSASHEAHNRAFWDADADDYQAAHGATLEAAPLAWGVWRIPEAEVCALGDVRDRDVLELGCGAARWSEALAALGARAVGLDVSQRQLAHAHDGVPLVCASAERAPLRDDSFDVVFGDHGALGFCDPRVTVPEVSRVLRPGGRLVFCITGFLKWLTDDDGGSTRTLRRRWFPKRSGRHAVTWPEGVAEFQLPYGEWIDVLGAHGLAVERLVHLRAPKGASTTYTEFVDRSWARRWPAEELWVVRLAS